MLRSYPSQSCCGMREVAGISWQSTEANLRDLLEIGARGGKAFVMTGVSNRYARYVNDLYKALKEANVGMVWKTAQRTNPNTGNKIVVLVWHPEVRKVRAYRKKHNL